jgi:hypothetical protein
MVRKWIPETLLAAAAVLFCLFSCHKSGDFIDEGKLGNGVHYYPVILNDNLYDTVTHKRLNLLDTTFSPGQTLIFELDYFSQDPVGELELWAGKSPGSLKKALEIPYSPTFYSPTKFADTVLFHYELPSGLDSLSKWFLQPRVVTSAGLPVTLDATIRIK